MDNSTSISKKEVEEMYESLDKKQLINILVEHFFNIKNQNNQIPWKKNDPYKYLGEEVLNTK